MTTTTNSSSLLTTKNNGYRLFNISTISDDLTREEAICQIAHTLDYLNQTTNDVFKRIEDSIQSARTKLSSYDSRIQLVNSKINHIKKNYTNKATKIYSSAKYPVQEDEQQQAQQSSANFAFDTKWKQLFVCNQSIDMKHKLQKYTTPYAPFDDLAFKDKLVEFGVPSNTIDIDRNSHINRENNIGLGSVLEDHIESVTSLLLFNTAQHPYKQTNVKDPLANLDIANKKARDQAASDQGQTLYEAPQSILKGEQLETIKKENIGYKPVAGDLPDFNVPNFLPDLVGIADIQYAQDAESIAPSNFITNDLPDILPDINISIGNNNDLPPSITSASVNNNAQLNDAFIAAPPPPPPPPPPPSMFDAGSSNQAGLPSPPPPPPPMFSSAPQPPPPPPSQAQSSEAQEQNTAPSSNGGDVRSSLLDEIVKFAGDKSKLNNIENRKKQSKLEKEKAKEIGASSGGGASSKEPAGAGLSLMDSLKQAMINRRKFLDPSGGGNAASEESSVPKPPKMPAVAETPTTGNSMMDSISKMIPPPAPSSQNKNENDDEIKFSDSDNDWE
jgi:WAS family protein 1